MTPPTIELPTQVQQVPPPYGGPPTAQYPATGHVPNWAQPPATSAPLEPDRDSGMSRGTKIGLIVGGSLLALVLLAVLIDPKGDGDDTKLAASASDDASTTTAEIPTTTTTTTMAPTTVAPPTTAAPTTTVVPPMTTPPPPPPQPAMMPPVVCMNLQEAQDLIQTTGVFLSHSFDASGQERSQILDSNWIVVSQDPAPGAPITEGSANLGAVKYGEPNPC